MQNKVMPLLVAGTHSFELSSLLVTCFCRQGSVIAVTQLEFENSKPVPSYDNTVRTLVSSLQSNSSVGDLQILSGSINSNGK